MAASQPDTPSSAGEHVPTVGWLIYVLHIQDRNLAELNNADILPGVALREEQWYQKPYADLRERRDVQRVEAICRSRMGGEYTSRAFVELYSQVSVESGIALQDIEAMTLDEFADLVAQSGIQRGRSVGRDDSASNASGAPALDAATGFLGGAALADALGIHATRREAFFQQLKRQRMSLGDDCWHEVREPRPNSPRFLYRVDSPKLRDLAAAYKNPKTA